MISPQDALFFVTVRTSPTSLGWIYCFRTLRHTAVTNVYQASRDLFLAQRFARHASPLTTMISTHVSDEDLRERVRKLAC